MKQAVRMIEAKSLTLSQTSRKEKSMKQKIKKLKKWKLRRKLKMEELRVLL